jgi:hypothetical protein
MKFIVSRRGTDLGGALHIEMVSDIEIASDKPVRDTVIKRGIHLFQASVCVMITTPQYLYWLKFDLC